MFRLIYNFESFVMLKVRSYFFFLGGGGGEDNRYNHTKGGFNLFSSRIVRTESRLLFMNTAHNPNLFRMTSLEDSQQTLKEFKCTLSDAGPDHWSHW